MLKMPLLKHQKCLLRKQNCKAIDLIYFSEKHFLEIISSFKYVPPLPYLNQARDIKDSRKNLRWSTLQQKLTPKSG